MNPWEIKVLYLGEINSRMSLTWPPPMPPLSEDFSIGIPYLGFLLKRDGQNILVDSGISEKFIVGGKAWGGLPAKGGRSFLEHALEKEGVGTGDIDTVIYTHLHNDHAAYCTLFTNARIIIQKDEWQNLLNPLPIQLWRKDYDPDLIPELKSMNPLMVEGDLELTDGIKLLKTPGHTLGSQSVAVNTKKGTVALIGDLCGRYHFAFPDHGEIVDMEGNRHPLPKAPAYLGPALASTIIYDYYAFYDSIWKVKAIVSRVEPGYIIPGHEPSLVRTGI